MDDSRSGRSLVHRWRRLSGIVLACLVLAGLVASPLCAATRADYDRTVSGICQKLEGIDRAERASPGSGKAAIDQLRKSLPQSLPVTTDDGQTVKVDFRRLRGDLDSVSRQKGKKRGESIAGLIGRLKTMQAASRPHRQPDPKQMARARSILSDVLARKEYRPAIWTTLYQKLIMALFRLLGMLRISEATATVIGWIFIVLAVVAFAGVLVFLILRLVNYGAKIERPVDLSEKRPRKVTRQSLESLLAEAESSAAERRYRDAFRFTYLATIYLLDRAKLVTYADGITNWEYLRALRKLSLADHAAVFQGMTLLFDELVYGKRDVSEQDYLSSVRQFRLLEGMV